MARAPMAADASGAPALVGDFMADGGVGRIFTGMCCHIQRERKEDAVKHHQGLRISVCQRLPFLKILNETVSLASSDQ